ncbi:EamA family transporter [Acinetobacter puyangensis]|uniref:EamA-like transporter family protein n=1 Tax=Acinetobacter puyangensis TaxID=1096779 RepID=A0A240EAC9_9GAMM|nr:DMT family transporter [Acinetobacter puyangensis]SNX45678.1 EamA-like transporter family protein [Acinetobacter puyangensis]
MLLLIIAALFSVSVSVTLKIYKTYKLSILQILAFNYVSASLLAFIYLKPDFSHFNLHTPWWLIVLLGILLPSIFWCLDRALQHAGLIKTEIAQRISVVLTILISAMIYQEQFSVLKIAGIVLGILAVVLMLMGKSGSQAKIQSGAWQYILAVWIGYAIIDLLFKYTSNLGLQFGSTLTAIFCCAALVMFAVNLFKSVQWHSASIFAGLGLGVLNFTNIYFYLQAHQQLKDSPAIVFAGMNILVVLFGIVAAILIFKEKMTTGKILGGLCAILAVYCLMQSML